jgi:outer membrane protein
MEMRFTRRFAQSLVPAFAAVVLLATAQPASAQAAGADASKIGFVSLDRILRDSVPAKAAQTKLETEFSKRQKDLQETGSRLKATADKFDKDSPVLSDSERQRRQRELADLDKDFQRHQPAEERRTGRRRRSRQQGDPLDRRKREVRHRVPGRGLREPEDRHHREGVEVAQRGSRADEVIPVRRARRVTVA